MGGAKIALWIGGKGGLNAEESSFLIIFLLC